MKIDVDTSDGNVVEYSVSEISAAIKRRLEDGFGRVRVRGEITELKRYPSGHIYFSLKDEGGKLAAIIWRGVASRLGMMPENGMEVIANGRISAYGERSSYQLLVEQMLVAGEGALLLRIEQLRKRLLREGLFDASRKRSLPTLPRLIGIVTSRQGAVLHDICTTIARRFPRTLLLWPVAVQGEKAAEQIVAAIEGLSSLEERPDLIIVARGGGSLEDLMAFNDERVVRAVAACPIPLISAVGHETDTTLIDFVADCRAPTPTAAAEMALPLRSELFAHLMHHFARLSSALSLCLNQFRALSERISAGLPDLPSLLHVARMRLDDRSQRLELALPASLLTSKNRYALVVQRLTFPRVLIERRDMRVQHVVKTIAFNARTLLTLKSAHVTQQAKLEDLMRRHLRMLRERLLAAEMHLHAVSPQAILARGYALIEGANSKPMTQKDDYPRGGPICIRFADGRRDGHVLPIGKKVAPQGDLEF